MPLFSGKNGLMLGRTNRRIDAITLRRTGGVAPIDRVCPREPDAYAYGCRSTDRRRHQERIRANARVAPGIFGARWEYRATVDPGQRLRAAAAVYECHAPVVAAGTFELISVRQGRAGVPCTCTPSTDVERIAAIKQRKRVMARSGVEFSLWPMCAGMARSRRFRPFACSSLLFFCCLGQF
jgi:hypothetical protein